MFGSSFKVERRVSHSGTIKKMKFAIRIGEIPLAFALTLPTFSGRGIRARPATRSAHTGNQAQSFIVIAAKRGESVDG